MVQLRAGVLPSRCCRIHVAVPSFLPGYARFPATCPGEWVPVSNLATVSR